MRITNNMLTQNLLSNLESSQNQMYDLQNQLSSGYKLTKPSDDPVGVGQAINYNSNIASVAQWQNNCTQALSFMKTTDGAVGNITSMVQQIRTLTVQAADDVNQGAPRTDIKAQVDQITQQLQTLANTQIGNKYIFGGTNTTTEPLASLGSTWAGNDDPLNISVGNGVTINTAVDGKKLFEDDVTNADGSSTEGLFKTLSDLSNALAGKDSTGTAFTDDPTTMSAPLTANQKTQNAISSALGKLDTNLDNISALRSDLGARVNRVTAISSQLDTTSTNLQQSLSGVQNADMAKTIMEFQNQKNVFNAALATGSQIIQQSLVNFMK